MTADEKYEKCKSVQELMQMYRIDELNSDTLEYLKSVCAAYEKHYTRLMRYPNGVQTNY